MLPKFRPILDTTSTCYNNVGSYLTKLLNPLTQNEFIIRDCFDAANKIKSIPPKVFDDGYIFASFGVESLFTNVPLHQTINIILDRVYNNKLIVKLSFQAITNFSNRLMVLVWVAPLVHFLQILLWLKWRKPS